MSIVLNASEVAAAAGMHSHYRTVEEALIGVLKRARPELYAEAVSLESTARQVQLAVPVAPSFAVSEGAVNFEESLRQAGQDPKLRVRAIVESIPHIGAGSVSQGCDELIRLSKPESGLLSPEEALAAAAHLVRRDAALRSNLKPNDVSTVMKDVPDAYRGEKSIRDAARQAMYTSHGTRNESNVLASLARMKRYEKVLPDDTLYKREIPNFGGKWFVCGRVDAMCEGTVIEIKSRVSQLFGHVPLYEKVQLHMYMWLTSSSESVLVESYEGRILDHAVPYEQAFVDRTFKGLEKFLRWDAITADTEGGRAARTELFENL